MAEDQGRYQMLWDCPGCGTEGLLGLDHRFCPNCGTAQDPKGRYFPSDEQKILVEDHPYHGADKVCPACDTPNGAASEFCQACGSPLDEAKATARRGDVVVDEGDTFEGETSRDARTEHAERRKAEEARRRREMAGLPPADEAPPARKDTRGGLGWVMTGCLAIVGLLVLGGLVFCAANWVLGGKGEVTVTGHSWKRGIAVERYGPVEKSAWEDEVPAKGTVLACEREVRDTKKVQDGEECQTRKKDLGDGTFKEVRECEPTYRTEKVYGQKCRYTVDDWKVERTEQAAGQDLNPRWPAVRLTREGTCLGCEREGKRTETYTVVLRAEDGATHTCDLSEARWRDLDEGQTVQASFGGLTGAIDCGSLK